MLFLHPNDGSLLGFIELETLLGASSSSSSVLRGMLVEPSCRGKSYARLFLSIWLGLCTRAGVTPATSRINKPLLALTLVRLGFTPLRGRDKKGLRGGRDGKRRKASQQPLAVEVSAGDDGSVILYCSTPRLSERLTAGFSQRELSSQRLVVAKEPPLPRGRVAHIRVRYAPPRAQAAAAIPKRDEASSPHSRSATIVHAPLAQATIGGRLRLSASQGPKDGGLWQQTAEAKAEVLRLLTGRLHDESQLHPA